MKVGRRKGEGVLNEREGGMEDGRREGGREEKKEDTLLRE